MDNGEIIIKFPISRALPRKNSHYYCFTLPDVLRRYKEWGNLTYGDLIKKETCATSIKCIWYGSSDNAKFMLIGCKGSTEEFKKYIEKVPGGLLCLDRKFLLMNILQIWKRFAVHVILDAQRF